MQNGFWLTSFGGLLQYVHGLMRIRGSSADWNLDLELNTKQNQEKYSPPNRE